MKNGNLLNRKSEKTEQRKSVGDNEKFEERKSSKHAPVSLKGWKMTTARFIRINSNFLDYD